MIEYHRESTNVEIGFTDDHSLFPLSPFALRNFDSLSFSPPLAGGLFQYLFISVVDKFM
jgi:hypothetical protein